MTISITPRKGNWMQTYTGRCFYPLDPWPQDIDILDIAHSLSMQCRYAGHTQRFYSVAEHCVLITRHYMEQLGGSFSTEIARQLLLHDAAEAYLVDLPRPVKQSMPEYRDIEVFLEVMILRKFGCQPILADLVKEYDERILHDEKALLMPKSPRPWHLIESGPLNVHINCWLPAEAKHQFLETANTLGLV